MSAYFCTSSVVWAGHDVYPTTESLDDLHAYRTGIYHHVMYTTPSLPTMLLHIIWFPGYRFWDFTISFYISRCIFLHTRALEYIPPTRRVLPLAHMIICFIQYILVNPLRCFFLLHGYVFVSTMWAPPLRWPSWGPHNSNKLQGGAPKIAKLVNITPITMVYRCHIYS